MIAKKIGNVQWGMLQKNGEKLIVKLENIDCVPESWINSMHRKGFEKN
jgi:hypothetical protein